MNFVATKFREHKIIASQFLIIHSLCGDNTGATTLIKNKRAS